MSIISGQSTHNTFHKTTLMKHPQTQHIKIIKPLAFEGVIYQSFNSLLKISLMVVIQWRETILILGSNDIISKTDLTQLRYIMFCVCRCYSSMSTDTSMERRV